MLERAMDMLAAELEIDPVELRRRNLIRPEQFPYRTLTGLEYDTGDYEHCLDEALRLAGYEDLRRQQTVRRERRDQHHMGIGVSCYVEVSANLPGFTAEYASVEVTPMGGRGSSPALSPTGRATTPPTRQIVASTLGIPVEHVDFLDGDTEAVRRGAGTGGSRSAQVGGSAVKFVCGRGARQGQAGGRAPARGERHRHRGLRRRAGGHRRPVVAVSWAILAEAALDRSARPTAWSPACWPTPASSKRRSGRHRSAATSPWWRSTARPARSSSSA